jgi:flagellar protein FlbD
VRAVAVRECLVASAEAHMIHLTRLNNQPLVVNADLIKFIENAPDTVITLLTGEKIVVRESVDGVLKRIAEFHDRFYRRVAPTVVFDISSSRGSSGAKTGDEDDSGEANS